jgi:hypothetical protein
MDKLGMSSFVKGESTWAMHFDDTRVSFEDGSVFVGTFDMVGFDNSWNKSQNKELENTQNKWWFLERESNKPILIEGEEIKDISLYFLGKIICTLTEDGIIAYSVNEQVNVLTP